MSVVDCIDFSNVKLAARRKFTYTANHPQSWIDSAYELNLAAKVLRGKVEENWHSEKPFRECYLSPYYMLIGYLLETLLKGILVAKGYKCVVDSNFVGFGVNGHDLYGLANKAELPIPEEESRILKLLTEHTTWVGRYPIATRWQNTFLIDDNNAVESTITYCNADLHQFDILIYRLNKMLEELVVENKFKS